MKTSQKYSFLIADDYSVIRQGISVIIKKVFFNAEIFNAEKINDIFKILGKIKIDLLILEIKFSDSKTINILSEIKAIQPDIKILIFSAYDENVFAIRYLNAGASGYLNKLSSEDEMKLAIHTMISSGKYLSQNLKDRILNSFISKDTTNLIDFLSQRESEVAQLLVKGYGNTEILQMLNIKKNTVSTYKNRIFEKLEVGNIADLIKLFEIYSDK